MDVANTYGTTVATKNTTDKIVTNPDSILGKDDFMRLLLTELQYQDPTDPMDTEKILTQTSQLATLEASNNTNETLESLSDSLSHAFQLSTVSAIGKMGSLGTDSILLEEGVESKFELYFPDDVATGTITIKDSYSNIVKTFSISDMPAGVNYFVWDGTDNNEEQVKPGKYSIESTFTTPAGEQKATAFGIYPIESVRFDNNTTLLRMGSSYYPLDQIAEIY